MSSQTLFTSLYQMKKEDSSYFYFTFEANDGVAFYSTLSSQGAQYFLKELTSLTQQSYAKASLSIKEDPNYRLILFHYHPSLINEFNHIMGTLGKMATMEMMMHQKIEDTNEYRAVIKKTINL